MPEIPFEWNSTHVDVMVVNNKDKNNGGHQRFYQDGRGPKKQYDIKNHVKRLFFGQDNGRID
jgi:hypothetical protein